MDPLDSLLGYGGVPLLDPAEMAALRMRQSARPDAGRREGILTALLEGLVSEPFRKGAGMMQTMRDYSANEFPATYGVTQQTTDYDPRREAAGYAAGSALNLLGGGTSFAQAGTAGIFGGRLAKTADQTKLARAEEMAAQGMPREQIWNETGWFQGPDQKWRFEIPDYQSTFNSDQMLPKEYRIGGNSVMSREGLASDVFSHPDYYSAYPNKSRMAVGQINYPDGTRGVYHPSAAGMSEMVGIDGALLTQPTPRLDWQFIERGPRSTMLHELQHATQEAEGFARGGSPSSLLSMPNPDYARYQSLVKTDPELVRYNQLVNSPAYRAEIDAQNKIWTSQYQPRLERTYAGRDYNKNDADQVFADFNDWKKGRYPVDEEVDSLFRSMRARGIPTRLPPETMTGSEVYSRLAGEVEARNVQRRMNMTPDELLAQPPWTTQDTPFERQILR